MNERHDSEAVNYTRSWQVIAIEFIAVIAMIFLFSLLANKPAMQVTVEDRTTNIPAAHTAFCLDYRAKVNAKTIVRMKDVEEYCR